MKYDISYQKELEEVTKNGLNIQFAKYENSVMHKIAVNQNGLALKYIKPDDQTDELCMTAIKNNYLALRYVHKQTFKICMLSLYKSDGKRSIIKMIKNPEINIYCEILKKYPSEMKYVCFNVGAIESEEQLFTMCLKRNGLNIQHIRLSRLTYQLCEWAVKNNGLAIQYVPECFCSEMICLLAIRQNVKAIKYINPRIRTTEMWTLALKKNGKLIKYLTINDFDKYQINSKKIIDIIKVLMHIAIVQDKDAIMYTISTPICKLLIDLQNKKQTIEDNISGNTVVSKENEYLLVTDKLRDTKYIVQGDNILFDQMILKMISLGMSNESISKEIFNLANELTKTDYLKNNILGYHYCKTNDNKYEIIQVQDTKWNPHNLRYDSDLLWTNNFGVMEFNKKLITNKIAIIYKFEVITNGEIV